MADVGNLVARPGEMSWEAAGSLFVAGTTAYAAVRAVNLVPGDTVVVSGAAGGVGSLAVQLAVDAGATVIGLAGTGHHGWLAQHRVIPVAYGDGVVERIKEASQWRIEAFIDTFGSGYVEMAIGWASRPSASTPSLTGGPLGSTGPRPKAAAAANADVLSELAKVVAVGRVEIPMADTSCRANVPDAYRQLEQPHTLGKIVLKP